MLTTVEWRPDGVLSIFNMNDKGSRRDGVLGHKAWSIIDKRRKPARDNVLSSGLSLSKFCIQSEEKRQVFRICLHPICRADHTVQSRLNVLKGIVAG